MKSGSSLLLILISILLCGFVFSQTTKKSDSLGLPGDNLDLYAVLDLFQKSKTIEDFEKSLNLEKTAISNLDLNLDKKVDFIKVVTGNNANNANRTSNTSGNKPTANPSLSPSTRPSASPSSSPFASSNSKCGRGGGGAGRGGRR